MSAVLSLSRSLIPGKESVLEEAQRFLVGGVNSPVRAFRDVGGDPLVLVRAAGAEVVDHHGQTFLDFIAGWGAVVLGHNPPVVVEALRRGLDQGVLFGLTHPAEVELARLIVEAVPSVEQVRFMASGTEACLTAVKLARAHTGRTKVLIFEGCYHGHGETLMAGRSAGIPQAAAQDVVQVPFNDRGAFEAAVERYGRELACVIIEPVAANMGVVVPEPGILARIRNLTSRYGILLIFDEVVTGFRVGPGGAQALFGVTPDLTVFGKVIGGGLPIGAVGAPKRLMQHLAPEGEVFHAGTFAGHPLSMAAGVAVLRELNARAPYERLEQLAARLAQGLAASAQAHGIPIQVNRVGSMGTVFFSETPVRNQADAMASRQDQFAQWAKRLRAQGVLVSPSPREALFLTGAHTDAHIERLIHASEAAFHAMGE